jgi:hypothetical protein
MTNAYNTNELLEALNHLDSFADEASESVDDKQELAKSYNYLWNFINSTQSKRITELESIVNSTLKDTQNIKEILQAYYEENASAEQTVLEIYNLFGFDFKNIK